MLPGGYQKQLQVSLFPDSFSKLTHQPEWSSKNTDLIMKPHLNILMLSHGPKINPNIFNTFFKCPVSWFHLSLLVKNPWLLYWRGSMATFCSSGRHYLYLPRPLVIQASLKRWSGKMASQKHRHEGTWECAEEVNLSTPRVKKLPLRHPLIDTKYSELSLFTMLLSGSKISIPLLFPTGTSPAWLISVHSWISA